MNFEKLIEMYPTFQIILSLIAFITYLLIRKFVNKVILERALLQNFEESRSKYIKKAVNLGLGVVLLVVVGIIWDISFKGLSVYVASILTVIGIGFFANWSIASNITASVVLFFFFPIKIGSKVKIVDGDNSAEGTIIGISLFSIRILREDKQEIFFPNNVAIQKSIVHINSEEEAQASLK